MKSFTEPDWEKIFKEAGYRCFDDWWNAEQNLVEIGNFRGPDDSTSWSHVSRILLPGGRVVYLKRQQNHYPNNIILKSRKLCTFEIEWQNYHKLQSAGIPTMKVVYYACRNYNGDKQCIIVSEELTGMSPISKLVKWFQKNEWPSSQERKAILIALAKVVKKMHSAGLIHNALYGRHIYVNIPFENGIPKLPDHYKICLIDLERTKSPGPTSSKLIKNDIEKMYRRIPEWPARDCISFLKEYLGIHKLDTRAKKTIRKISSKARQS